MLVYEILTEEAPLTRTRFSCRAILFDLDGVLVHSAEAVDRSWQRWALDNGLDPATVAAAAHGRRTVDTIRQVAPTLDAASAAAQLESEQSLDLAGVRAGIGARELVAGLGSDVWAVVTSGTRRLAQSRLRAAGLPEPPILVAGDDVANGKPDPAGYLLACALLHGQPSACVVVEDAPAGVTAARAAGMRAIALAKGDTSDLFSHADAVACSCEQLRVCVGSDHGLLVEVLGSHRLGESR